MSGRGSTLPFGRQGEQLAADFLRGKQYRILGMNWRCTHGEIDLIAQDGETVVFVEVRSRHSDSPTPAFESVGPQKQRKMAACAQAYLDAHGLTETAWRVDLIAIAVPRQGRPLIEHAEHALDW